jgi:hypothetical protein
MHGFEVQTEGLRTYQRSSPHHQEEDSSSPHLILIQIPIQFDRRHETMLDRRQFSPK